MTNRVNAQGQPFLMNSWKDNTAYCARRHKYGPIQSLADEARAIGEPSLIKGTILIAPVFAVIALVVGVWA